MKFSLEAKLIAGGFGLAMWLMAVISVISYQNATSLSESTDKLKKTHQVLETLIGILASINESEAGRRGYIFFGDESELERHNQAIANIKPTIEKLRLLIGNDIKEIQRIKTLEALIEQRIILSQKAIELYEKNRSYLSEQNSLVSASKENRLAIRETIAQMQQYQEQQLEIRVQESQTRLQWRMLIEAIGTFLSFIILFTIYILLYRQMNKRRQAEITQRALTQEKELGEMKLEFFSMVSHEFRTPLSIILGSAQLLKETLEPIIEKKKLKNLYRIQSSARLMTQLLTDILTLARAEAGKLEFKPELVELQSFCLNLIEDIQVLSQTQQSIKFLMEGNCTHAFLDQNLLYSILSNLLSNAIKYSPQGKNIYFKLVCNQDSLIFQVKDEGMGIPKEIQPQLYQPFSRAYNVKGIVGIGLGLAIVKKCLDLHGGQISLDSEVGKGTTFTVSLPKKTLEKT